MIPTIHQAISLGFKRIYIPPIELSLFDNEISLLQTETIYEETEKTPHICFSAIRGHTDAKRAMLLAAAGGHHVLMSGPPGGGKSLLANAFHTICRI